MRIFLDTSALAKRYVQEPGSEELEIFFSSGVAEVVVSTLAFPEFGAALGRKVREKEIPKKEAANALEEFELDWNDLFIKIPVTEDIARSAVSLAVQYPLKGADAIHLATALSAGAEIMVTSDQQLKKISEKEGIKAYDPAEGPYI